MLPHMYCAGDDLLLTELHGVDHCLWVLYFSSRLLSLLHCICLLILESFLLSLAGSAMKSITESARD